MNNHLTSLIITTGLIVTAQGAMTAGQIVAVDFGGTTSTDASTTWNHLSVGGTATTLGLADAGTAVILGLVDTSNAAVPSVTFTLTNSSGQIAFDFTGTGGTAGDGLFTDASVYGDAIISSDAAGAGRPVAAGTDFFTFTFDNLDDSLDYNIVGGWRQLNGANGNTNFNAVWSADGQSFSTDASGDNGYDSLTGLSTDGSGNLVITVTGIDNAAHITASGITLEAVPEPSTSLLAGIAGLGFVIRRRR